MLGAVGGDRAAGRIAEALRAAGVEPLFDTKPPSGDAAADGTGVCCCLIAAKERTMVTSLGAGKTLHLHGKLAPAWPSWATRVAGLAARGPMLVVTTAFYAAGDDEGGLAMLDWRKGGEGAARLLAFAISAQWCCGLPVVQTIARSADFIFANEPEILELAAKLRSAGSISEETPEGDSVAAMAAVARWKERGWVVVTRGSKSVAAMAAAGARPLEVPVRRIPSEEVVDDVGAGDSFMGGFLAEAWRRLASAEGRAEAAPPGRARSRSPRRAPASGLSEADVEAAAKVGIAAAAQCLRSMGCNFPAGAE